MKPEPSYEDPDFWNPPRERHARIVERVLAAILGLVAAALVVVLTTLEGRKPGRSGPG
jgi:hypothetical protein